MKVSFSSTAALVLFLVSGLGSAVAAEFHLGAHRFTLPPGFVIELAAGTNLVQRPISADFDERGRLYVTDSAGSNDKVQKQLEEKKDRVLRLEDTTGSGKFDRASVFADGLMFPEGALWLDGSLYVSTPPSIWKLTETAGTGKATQREEWFQGKTLTGCANDLHGPYAGPDGWIYWCKGAFAEQTHTLRGQPFTTRASHIFRARPDGTGLESVLTGGMDNPVSVAFSAEGERFLVGTFFQHPEAGRRDGIIHAIYGGVYGKDHDVLEGHRRTGELLPMMTHLGPAAPCSVIRYQSTAFGRDYTDNLLVSSFNLHKVTRHVLAPAGATYTTRDEDFLVSDNTDFHPTCLLEDADGSLLVVDTGGWYKLCCPTSQLWKPEVLGAIYRVRKTGASAVADPRGRKIDWSRADLTGLLGDARPAVRQRALSALAQRGESVVPVLEKMARGKNDSAALNAAWALSRIDGERAARALRGLLTGGSEGVRRIALHSVWTRDDKNAAPVVKAIFQKSRGSEERLAAQALGRIGGTDASATIVAAAAKIPPGDRVLEHSLIYALIELGSPEVLKKHLQDATFGAKRAALIALDQIPNGGLRASDVVPDLTSGEENLRQTAQWITAHHPEWDGALADFFRGRLGSLSQANLQALLPQFLGSAAVQKVVANFLSSPGLPPAAGAAVLDVVARTSFKESPAELGRAVRTVLGSRDEGLGRAAIGAARNLGLIKNNAVDFSDSLRALGADGTRAEGLRIEALAALPRGLMEVEPDLFDLLLGGVEGGKAVLIRNNAAAVLGRSKLSNDQLLRLAPRLHVIGPMELIKILPAYALSKDERVGLKLIESLQGARSASAVRPEILRPVVAKYAAPVPARAEEFLGGLNAEASGQKARLDELVGAIPGGDVYRGQAIFNHPRAACASCHTIGYVGGKVGPDLTRIGQVRTERDLLESIVYPSASFARSFEPVVVSTKSGDDLTGIIKKDSADEVILTTGPNAEVRVARAEVTEMRPGTVSIMPAGLDQQLSRGELADLVAFLRACR